MFGAMRAGIVPVPLNTKLGPDTLHYVIEDSGCGRRGRRVRRQPARRRASSTTLVSGFASRSMAPGPGWLDYESELGQRATPTFAPPALGGRSSSFLPYTSGSTGKPERRRLDPCRPALVARLPAALLANASRSPGARRRAALPQERHGRRHQADAERQAARSCSCPISSRRRFLRALSDYRCTHASGVPAVFTLLLQERELIASLDFSSLKGLKIGSAPTPKELLDAVEAAFRRAGHRRATASPKADR